MLPAGVIIAFPRMTGTYFPAGAILQHGEVGYPPWLSWDDPGTWHVHAVGLLVLVAAWCASMAIGARLERWKAWRVPGSVLAIFVVLPVASLAIGVGFSLNYWGYPWSLPDLDSRVTSVKWRAVGSFLSRDDGTSWELQPPEELTHFRSEPAVDLECCQDGRILDVVRRQQPLESLAPLTDAEVRTFEAEMLPLVSLDPGEPGYPAARHLRGVLAAGNDEEGHPVVFASFTGLEASNDHHPTYEVLLRREAPPTLLSSRRYYGDVAGIEGFTAFAVAVYAFFFLGLVVFPLLVISGSLARSIFVWARWRFSLRGTRQ